MAAMQDVHEQQATRRQAFLDWARHELQNIDCLQLSNGKDSKLRRYRKTILFGLLETLARAFDSSSSPGQRFVKLVETQGVWAHGTHISVVHLARALDLHLRQFENKGFSDLKTYLEKDFAWAFEKSLCSSQERTLTSDPKYDVIEQRWPGCTQSSKLVADEKPLAIWDFKHSSLLYRYRSCIIHESREQGLSISEKESDVKPVYLTVSNPTKNMDEYHLVYPVGFLKMLATSCINVLENSANFQQANLRSNFRYGPYVIQELNYF